MRKLKMKLLVAAICALVSAGVVSEVGAAATVTWDVVPGATGYKFYCGSTSGAYGTTPVFDHTGQPVMNQRTVTFAPGTYFCALTAYNAAPGSESVFSTEVVYTEPKPVKLPPPGNVTITFKIVWDDVTGKWKIVSSKIISAPTTP